MIRVLLSWIILFGTTAGIGYIAVRALSRLTGRIDDKHLNGFQLFWIGVAVTVATAHLFHFLFPLNTASLALWLFTGIAGLSILLRNTSRAMWSHSPAIGLNVCIRLLLFTALILLLAYLGASGAGHKRWSGAYDTDLYHFNVVRWMNEYPVVPGLGNLHSRLAHTSGFLTYSSLVDNLWWDGRSAWITYGLFVTVVCAQWLWIIIVCSGNRSRRVTIFGVGTLAYVLQLQTTIHPTLYFDEIALLVQMVLALELLVGIRRQHEGGLHTESFTWTRITLLATLAALGFSIKPIGAVSLIFTLSIAGYFAILTLVREESSLRTKCFAICGAGAIAGFLLAGHILRNVIMTGWLLFPAPAARLNVDWAMPCHPAGGSNRHEMQSVAGQYHVIRAWARLPGPRYREAMSEGLSCWFPQWRDRVWNGIEPRWFYLGSIMILLHLGRATLSRRARSRIAYDIFIITLSGTNIVYWFMMAPDMRFGRGFFWIWMGIGTAFLLEGLFRRHYAAFVMAILLSVYSMHAISVSIIPRNQPLTGIIGKAASKTMKQVVIENGQSPPLQVYVPVSGDQSGDSPLPSTPYPLNTLMMRTPGVLRDGFRSESSIESL